MKFLIVGLGNIGPEYSLSRHNIGFMILDQITKKEPNFKTVKYALKQNLEIYDKELTLIKPTTYE